MSTVEYQSLPNGSELKTRPLTSIQRIIKSPEMFRGFYYSQSSKFGCDGDGAAALRVDSCVRDVDAGEQEGALNPVYVE